MNDNARSPLRANCQQIKINVSPITVILLVLDPNVYLKRKSHHLFSVWIAVGGSEKHGCCGRTNGGFNGNRKVFLSANEFEKKSAFLANDNELRPSTSAHSSLSEE